MTRVLLGITIALGIVAVAGCRLASDVVALAPIAQDLGKTFNVHSVSLTKNDDGRVIVAITDTSLARLPEPVRADTSRALGRFVYGRLPTHPTRLDVVLRVPRAGGKPSDTTDVATYRFQPAELSSTAARASRS
jgi:hypothetical protein